MLKGLERLAKTLLSVTAALLLWRPGRRQRAATQLRQARRVLLVRIDNRVGEALLMTPLLEALFGTHEVDVLVHQKAVRVLQGHPKVRRIIGLDRRWLALGALAPGLKPLRRERYDAVINCGNWETPSVTHGLISRLCAPGAALVGPAAGWPGTLMDVAVAPRADTASERAQRLHLLTPLGVEPTTLPSLSFRAPNVGPMVAELLKRLAAGSYAVVNPGGRLDYRRVPPEVFAVACRHLSALGKQAVVTWGPGEERLAQALVASAPSAVMAPPTTLDELAALMAGAALTVCNNTGPMHLSVAMRVPTLALFYKMPIERWGYPEAPHHMLDLTAQAGDASAMGAKLQRALTEMIEQR